VYLRLAGWPLRVLARTGRILLVAFAAAFGAPAPKFLRHEDAVVQVADEEVRRE
jgi:hypothetical protein